MSKAKTLTSEQYRTVRGYVADTSTRVLRDLVALSLTFRAGLRAAEAAGLNWEDVLDPMGQLTAPLAGFEIPCAISKKGSGRIVPMHPDLHADLSNLRAELGTALTRGKQPILHGNYGDRFKANTLQRYLGRLYDACGLTGVSSHSGRRTFITTLARAANEHGCSLYDVQKLAGHSDISTTAGYIDNSDRVGKLVGAL
jgi:integrase